MASISRTNTTNVAKRRSLSVEAREMLRAQDRRFAGDCCIAGAVNALFAVRPDAEPADGLQPLDDAGQIPLAQRFRPSPQPGERRTVFNVGNGKQRFQPCDHFR